MANSRDIKRRIKSIHNTQQITKAMKMVAASKLRKSQESVLLARPYSEKLRDILSRIMSANIDLNDPLLEVRPAKKIAYVVITAERGLAAGYNINLIKKAKQEIDGHSDKEVSILTAGKKGKAFFEKNNYQIDTDFGSISDIPTLNEAKTIARKIKEDYSNENYDEIYLVYTKFVSVINQVPQVTKLLPIDTEIEGEETPGELDYIFEPNTEIVLNQLLPLYLQNQVFGALMEAKASEHGARMTAMDSATNNADDMIDSLELTYNRARQAAITNEISEIVAGANALQG
ncbi:ATP synthase F1 subcomplex gamma subunit [Desulfonispora thiosulfatigenes DSM 11270]|uniref:ATP synthase gamma chain n=1 Tax=Desulfonispora thiosulfatigenes DSM 11270 TaxID=656914 RepID=A0A1W1V4E5_DESTI|nr:ATP synthase F1 subunit gamma [Desulfonispora thiosulfatigenes]SMB88218.1 ATP synthase F1 subcomplex gamma subunit [Desulfonispora thiosulfatigenes DSM 11270]